MNKPKYIDIHSHINFKDYDEDRDDVISRAKENDTWMVNVGTGRDTSEEVVELTKHDGIYAVVGLHPIHTNKSHNDEAEDFDYDFYKKLTENEKVVAIGECGLDYFRLEDKTEESVNRQKDAFRRQIDLALETDLPLMIHCREAYPDTLEILQEYKEKAGGKLRGDFHFFAGTLGEAKEILDLGFNMSFTGVITFTDDYDELIKFLPIDRIMSETDCPYVTPAPHRGKRNEPVYVSEVAKRIAEIKGLDAEEVTIQLVDNALRFFNLKAE
jgi:TatD DNase family protein